MQIQIHGMSAIVTSRPTERQEYEGKGEQRKVIGRLRDSEGRALSGASVVVITQEVGMVSDGTIYVPDGVAMKLVEGTVVSVPGTAVLRMMGGDYGSIRGSVTGVSDVSPRGTLVDLLASAPLDSRTTGSK